MSVRRYVTMRPVPFPPVLRPNNSFKPNLFRYGKSVARKACLAFSFTTQVGLILVLYGRAESDLLFLGQGLTSLRAAFRLPATTISCYKSGATGAPQARACGAPVSRFYRALQRRGFR